MPVKRVSDEIRLEQLEAELQRLQEQKRKVKARLIKKKNKENTKVLIAIGKQFEKHLGFLPELEDVSLIGETLDELGFKEFFEDELKKKDERTSEEEKEEDFDSEEESQEDSQEGRQSQSSVVLESVKARDIWTAGEVERAFGY